MQENRLYVGNLNYACTNEQLSDLFAGHGMVKDVTIIEGRGFGFIELDSPQEAEAAKEALNDTEFLGRTLRVNEAHPPKDKNQSSFSRPN